jgi:hypothetical protein
MGRFFIDKQPAGWRWYSYAGLTGAIAEMREGFKTRGAALADARAFFADLGEG